MSISSSLANAVSGLSAAARKAEVISANVANANTDGYGRREVTLAATTISGGVRVEGITRNVNAAAIADRRLSDAALGNSSVPLDFYRRLEDSIGLPGDPSSLSNLMASLEQKMVTAVDRPDDKSNLTAIVYAASQVANKLNDVSKNIQDARKSADAQISFQVSQVNTSLEIVEGLNKDIKRLTQTNADVSSLLDQRQMEIDKISGFIPLQEVPKEHNQVALVTKTGATLLDTQAAKLVFSATPLITPYKTLADGTVSDLVIEDAASQLGSAAKSIEGGSLAASFALRDTIAPNAQTQIDALARNLIERFSGPAADASLAIGQAGLFTDAGSDFDPLTEVALSSRISVNSVVDASQGGDAIKLRDGIAAVGSLPIGENATLVSMREALVASQFPSSGTFSTSGGASDLVSDALSQFGASLRDSEARQAFSVARSTALKDIELQSGVSTDDELQKLLVVEQAYAANARVIQAVDEMLQSLLRI